MADRTPHTFPSNWPPRERIAAILARAELGWSVEEHGDYAPEHLDRADTILDDELAPALLGALLQELYADTPGLAELREAIDAGQTQGHYERALPGTNHGRLILARFLQAAGYSREARDG